MSQANTYQLPRPFRLVLVGGVATFAYCVFSLGFVWLAGFSAPVSSVLGQVLAGFVSYFGHRVFTFGLSEGHEGAPGRFILLNATAYGVAAVTPWIAVELLGLPNTMAIVLTAVIIPFINLILIPKFVFREAFIDSARTKIEFTHGN